MRRPARMNALLIMQCLLMLSIAVFGDLSRHVPVFLFLFAVAVCAYLLAVRVARFDRVSLKVVVLWAILLRLPMFVAPPSLSDDVWRYIHDGNAQRAGVNPYRYAPADTATGNYRGPEYGRINHPNLPTIYPPLAQLTFRIAAWSPRTLIVWRLFLLAAEIGIVLAGAAFLRRRNGNTGNLAIYAWHPLAIIESI